MSFSRPGDHRPLKRRKTEHSYVQPESSGFLTNASGFVINQPTMIGMHRVRIIPSISAGKTGKVHTNICVFLSL